MSFPTLGLSDHGPPRGGSPGFRLSPGTVLSKTVTIWLKCLLPFWIVALIVQSPTLLVPFLLEEARAGPDALRWTTTGVTVLMFLVVEGALSYGTLQQLRGRRAGIVAILGVGLSRATPVFLVALLLGMALVAAGLAAAFFFGFLLGFLGLVRVVFYASLVAAAVVMAAFWVAVPTAVVERPGAFASMRRSRELTEDNRLRILAVFLVLWVVNYGVQQLMPQLILWTGLTSTTTGGAVALWAASAPFDSLGAVSAAVGYHELRTGKEGVDVEELVKVFE
jgi:hypothetical protein